MKRKGARLGLGILVMAGLVTSVTALVEWRSEVDARGAFPPPGRLVKVAGLRYDLYCTGSGQPTVVLDAGLGETLVDWQLVQPRLNDRLRVCSYDRAGLGWSDGGSVPRDAAHLALTLDRLLRAAGERGPFVLVGHSMSGLTARVFAARYPAETYGVVLVDAASPDDGRQLPPQVAAQQRRQFAAADLCSGVTVIDRVRRALGLDRLTAQAPAATPSLPTLWRAREVAVDQRWLAGQAPACEAGYREYAALPRSDAEAARVQTLGRKPLAVVTRGLAETWPPTVPAAATEAAWRREQDQLLTLSSRSKHLTATHARHYIMLDEPQIVVQAVLWVVRAGRNAHLIHVLSTWFRPG